MYAHIGLLFRNKKDKEKVLQLNVENINNHHPILALYNP